jgi:8-oxo-dGTP diphosphatase
MASQAQPQQVFHAYDAAGNSGMDGLRFCPRCATACVTNAVGGRPRLVCPDCTYVHFRNPAPGVAVAVLDAGQVVLGKRVANVPFGGQWGLPAGFVEFDEDFLSAARREVREETGLEVEVTGILNVTSNYLTAGLHSLVIALAARAIGGRLDAGDDFCDVRWVPVTGPFPPLAYDADASLLRVLGGGGAPLLPVDARYARAQSVLR